MCVFLSENITGVPTFYYCRLFHAHALLIVIPVKGLIIASSPSDPLLSTPLEISVKTQTVKVLTSGSVSMATGRSVH